MQTRNVSPVQTLNELPIVSQGDNLLVSAILLHKKLKVQTAFSRWFQRRIEKYGFEINQDFLPNLAKSKGGRKAMDYLLTLDMAKEMSMLEENEIGRQIRRYFIQKEKEARGVSQLPKENAVFKGLTRKRFNDRLMMPYRDVLERSGYKRNSNGNRSHRYWMHFIKEGNQLWVTEEFARHLYFSKMTYNNRAVMLNSQPVLPFNFGDVSRLEKGGSHASH